MYYYFTVLLLLHKVGPSPILWVKLNNNKIKNIYKIWAFFAPEYIIDISWARAFYQLTADL